MRHAVRPLVALSAALLLSVAPAQDRVPKRYALLVGVNGYDKPGFQALKYAERDVTELAAVLTAAGYEAKVLLGSKPGADRATRKNVLAALTDWVPRATARDTLVVALAGHGLEADGKPYFCPADAVRDEAGTLVPLAGVVDAAEKHAGVRVLLVDACRNDPDSTRGRGIDRNSVTLRDNTALLLSCRSGQRAYESDTLRHGLFFHCVLEGLRGNLAGAKDAKGAVTFGRLGTAVEEAFAEKFGEWVLNPEARQAPQIASNLPAGTVLVPPDELILLEKLEEFEYVTEGERKKGRRRVLSLNIGCGEKVEFVRVPKGTFTMGSPDGEAERSENEGRRRVEIPAEFYLGKFEVTQAQYKAVTGKTPSHFTGDQLPVEQVSWDEATGFCEAVSKKTGRKVVLPTEEQWEYACRAGTTTPFHFGSKLNGGLANCDGNYPYGGLPKGAYNEKTTDVGSYPANPWGLHDMHGNVGEWCENLHSKEDSLRVLRGGGWSGAARYCRSANRFRGNPASRDWSLGFRLALVPSGGAK